MAADEPVAQEGIYPLEILVAETPRSLGAGARSRERWKATVAAAARRRIDETDGLGFLHRRPVALTIYYFTAVTMEGDVDNLVKPIMDALIRIAYLDDNDVERVVVQRFEPWVERDFVDPSPQLAEALDTAPPVVYIRVDDDLRWRRVR